ncbi:MAG: T9SS type A sorting domain-containing protein [Bacteroidia bacterium]|nr:T9SS type A sorting domain-containing protein [Bacteroidia bacterium]
MKAALFFCFNLIILSAFSQVGKDCANPNIINSLPFSFTGTTSGYGMDYQVGPNNTTYMSGNDYVLQFHPATNMNISINLLNTNSLCGLFLFNNCPDAPGVHCVSYVEAASGNPSLYNIAVYSDTVYYIIIDTYNVANLFPSTTFNINVVEAFSIDLEAVMLRAPRTSCSLTDTAGVVLLYKNMGNDTLYNVPVGYQIDNNPPVIETHSDQILPYQSYYYTFNTRADLTISNKTYNFKIFTAYVGDVNSSNDTIYFPITNNNSVSTFPYFQDFESNTVGWTTAWIDQTHPGSSWQWGTPAKTTINSAASGTKCWVTDTIGNYLSNENSYVIGPCFDFSSLTLPVLEFDLWYKTATADIAQIEYTTDNVFFQNMNWHRLGNTGDGNNWYNTPSGYSSSGWNGSSGGWLHARHALDSLIGKPFVIFRIVFRGGVNGVDEGIAIDNIKISESPLNDLSVDQIIEPIGSCRLTVTDSVKVKIINHGMNSIHDFDVKCSVDGGITYVTETIADTLDFQESMIYKFNSTFNFGADGLYKVIATTALPSEQNTSNDTAYADVMHYSLISNYPYVENFETNNGNWYATGLNSSWQWGVVADTALTTASSGTHAWATNLTGYHNLAERSYVTSPCIDLTSMQNPMLKMMIWYKETYPTYCQLKISTDGGNVYSALGSASDPDWYNAGYSWTYSSLGWKQVKHSLKNYISVQDVRLQFYFEGTVQNKGFAFDSIVICDAPLASFTEINNKGWQVKFNNTSTLMDSCKWDFNDGSFSTEINPVHPYASSDTVLVTLIVYNSCGSDTIKKWVHPKYVGITDNQIESMVNLYPNPVKDELNVELMGGIGNCVIEINNVQGETVILKNINIIQKSKVLIPTNKLASGLYYVKISRSKGILNRKIVKY